MIKVVACQCGSSDTLVRSRLGKFRYKDTMTIPIVKGKEKSLAVLNNVPQFPEVNDLRKHLASVSKWAVIIGYDEDNLRWVDLANGSFVVNDVQTGLILEHFA